MADVVASRDGSSAGEGPAAGFCAVVYTDIDGSTGLWERHPATARDVIDRLPVDVEWAYTTVKTMLTRLAAKNAVSESKRGNTSVYEPLVSRSKARSSALNTLLNQAFGGGLFTGGLNLLLWISYIVRRSGAGPVYIKRIRLQPQ